MTTRPSGNRSRPEQWTHGRNCYANHGCRCAVCTEGMRVYQLKKREEARLLKERSAVTFSARTVIDPTLLPQASGAPSWMRGAPQARFVAVDPVVRKGQKGPTRA
jgi:hypothetical protein